MDLALTTHQLLVAALLVPFLALGALVLACSFGLAWRGYVAPKGRR